MWMFTEPWKLFWSASEPKADGAHDSCTMVLISHVSQSPLDGLTMPPSVKGSLDNTKGDDSFLVFVFLEFWLIRTIPATSWLPRRAPVGCTAASPARRARTTSE